VDVSSARPDDLEDFSRRSHGADREIESLLSELKGRYHEFVSENHWGVFEAGSLLGAFGRYLQGNDFSARWVAGIAASFRHAGGSGALVRLPDRAINASLRAAGLDHHRRSVTSFAPGRRVRSRVGFVGDGAARPAALRHRVRRARRAGGAVSADGRHV
jgi:hypothetical protein